MYWNKQNKHNVNLFKTEMNIYGYGDLQFQHSGFYQNSDRLNKKISKMSPRRHKKAAEAIIDGWIKGDMQLVPDNFEELFEVLSND